MYARNRFFLIHVYGRWFAGWFAGWCNGVMAVLFIVGFVVTPAGAAVLAAMATWSLRSWLDRAFFICSSKLSW
jgi:hypothetical protein